MEILMIWYHVVVNTGINTVFRLKTGDRLLS
jgi:hypothetical protein